MLHYVKFFILLIFSFSITIHSQASEEYSHITPESITIGISENVSKGAPFLVKKITEILENESIKFELVEQPHARVAKSVNDGDLMILLISSPDVLQKYSNLIQIEPAITSLNLWLHTSTQTPHLCNYSQEDLKNKGRIAGIIDNATFMSKIYPLFNSHVAVNSNEQVYKMIQSGRADFFIARDQQNNEFYRCGSEPFLKLNTYSYVNNNFPFLIDKLSNIYQKHF